MASIPTAADLDVVRRIAVLRGLKPSIVEELIAPAQILVLRDGEALFHQGDPATAFFIVVDGWVKLHRITESGDEAVIHVFAKGDSIAEAVAFTGHAYPASAQIVSDARIVRIPADHVIRCIRSTPDIALAMLASTTLHLLKLVQQIEQLKAKSGFQRVAEFLAALCSVEQGSCTIALPYDKTLIAGRLGLMPESLSRAFTKLRPLGITVRASHVVVKDVAKLRRYASGDRGSTRAFLAAMSKPPQGRRKST